MIFYRNLFATLCFAFFVVALATRAPWAYLGAMFCGALSRTAVKKKWPDPPVKGRLLRWFGAAPAKPEDDPDRSRCGGADLATD